MPVRVTQAASVPERDKQVSLRIKQQITAVVHRRRLIDDDDLHRGAGVRDAAKPNSPWSMSVLVFSVRLMTGSAKSFPDSNA